MKSKSGIKFVYVIVVWICSGLSVKGHTFIEGPPPLPMNEDQRICLEGRIGSPSQDSKPDLRKLESAARECGIEIPNKMMKPEFNGKAEFKKKQDQTTGFHRRKNPFKILKAKNSSYIRLDGAVPKDCREKVSLSYQCQDEGHIAFVLKEISKDGFKCIEESKLDCSLDQLAEGCISFDELAEDKRYRNRFENKIGLNSERKKCDQIDFEMVISKVEFKKFSPKDNSFTEAGFCEFCNKNDVRFSELQDQIEVLQKTINKLEKKPMLPVRTDPPKDNGIERHPPSDRAIAKRFREPRPDDENDDFVERPQEHNRRLGTFSMGGMNMMGMNGMNMMGMNGMNMMGMGGMNMMGMGGMNMMGMGGMNMMGMNGMNMMGMNGMNMMGMNGMNMMGMFGRRIGLPIVGFGGYR